MYRNISKHLPVHAPGKDFHEAITLKKWQHPGGKPAADKNTTDGQHLERQVGRLCGQNIDPDTPSL